MSLTFDEAAADRWESLTTSDNAYDIAVRKAVIRVLRRLATEPARHRVGATQFTGTPMKWACVVDVGQGADWVVVWTTNADGTIHILGIGPAPSL